MTKDATTAAPARRPYLTPADVASELGMSRRVVYEYLNAGIIPGRKLGARWFVPRAVLADWLQGESWASWGGR